MAVKTLIKDSEAQVEPSCFLYKVNALFNFDFALFFNTIVTFHVQDYRYIPKSDPDPGEPFQCGSTRIRIRNTAYTQASANDWINECVLYLSVNSRSHLALNFNFRSMDFMMNLLTF